MHDFLSRIFAVVILIILITAFCTVMTFIFGLPFDKNDETKKENNADSH